MGNVYHNRCLAGSAFNLSWHYETEAARFDAKQRYFGRKQGKNGSKWDEIGRF
jgi:hypothetical protein